MADTKITGLTATTAPIGTDVIPIVTDIATTAVTKKATFATIRETLLKMPDGMLINGVITPSVTSNNLTLALKTKAGADPSASDPVYIWMNGTIRSVSAALSVTKNAGTNWCNAGSAELATKEIDYFAYIGYNATDGVVIGFSRIPYAKRYDAFSATSTAETYAAISTITTAAAGDYYYCVGRFAATLSAGAGYTWSVPTYTAKNLIKVTNMETRWLDWQPAYTASGSLTYTSVTTTYARYKVRNEKVDWELKCSGTLGGTASTYLYATVPFEAAQSASSCMVGSGNTAGVTGGAFITAGSPDTLTFAKYDVSNYGTSGASVINMFGAYEVT